MLQTVGAKTMIRKIQVYSNSVHRLKSAFRLQSRLKSIAAAADDAA